MYFFTNKPLSTENNALKIDAKVAYSMPSLYLLSKLKIIYNPKITPIPKATSTNLTRLLKNIGSINVTKKAPVLIVTKATDTLETLMALKKKIQCSAITIPEKKNRNSPLASTAKDFFRIRKYTAVKIDAKNILYQTKGIASIEISAPKIAVKPQINIMRCNKK